jgi:hypothetical protein
MSINDFAQALQSKEHTRYAEWFADDMRLYTPIHDEPTVGKETATQVLQVVFSLFENFQYSDVVAGHGKSHALIFRAKIGSDVLHGVDYLRMTPDGLVTEFHVMVRPLGALRDVQTLLDWSELRVYDLNDAGKNHGILLGTNGWKP